MNRPQIATVVVAAAFVLVSWSSSWFEITAIGTYTEGPEREPTIRTQYIVDNSQETFELTIDNATPLLLYWINREDVSSEEEQGESEESPGEPKGEGASKQSSEPCSGSCLDWVRSAVAIAMFVFVATMCAAVARPSLVTSLGVITVWLAGAIVIVGGIPLAAAIDFGISGGEGDSDDGSATGGFDSETQDSVPADQFAHFEDDSVYGIRMNGIVFTYDSVGYDLGLLEEGDRKAVIDNPPDKGEPGYESLVRFHGELSLGPGAILSWWSLLLPLMAFAFTRKYVPNDEEE
jgi:hypothetical protein